MFQTIGQTPVRKSDKQRLAYRTDADAQVLRKGSACLQSSGISGIGASESWAAEIKIIKERDHETICLSVHVSNDTCSCGGGAPRLFRSRKCNSFARGRQGDRRQGHKDRALSLIHISEP